MDSVGLLAAIGAYWAAIYVCFQKGRHRFALLGIIGLIPFLTPILGWFPVVGAIRLGTPDSPWAKSHYSPAQMYLAAQRYPSYGSPHDQPPPATTDGQSLPTAMRNTPADDGVARHKTITDFLRLAADNRVIDAQTFERLHTLYRQSTMGAAPVEAPRSTIPGTDPPVFRPYQPIPPAAPAPTETQTYQPARPLTSPPPLPPPAVITQRMEPEQPVVMTPSRVSQLWDSASSDIAVHGLAYLGVLVTLVGTLGFLIFAFVEMDDNIQPFVELFLAAIFFGWAWMLRRQEADRVAAGMELIGGVVLPIIWFAGLVDNAPFPPDFQDGPLVVAMTVSTVALAAIYAWISARNLNSTLRFLVGPLIWLGVMTLGFVFKTDEVLTSVAITRLVPAQPAMAAAAIALTLAFCQRRPSHRLVPPTFTAALVGLPVAYLLTVSLTVASGWTRPGPILLLGVATMVSAELLAVRFEKQTLVTIIRPILVAGVILPLLPAWGVGGTGFVAVVAYVGLFEWQLRSNLVTDTWQLPLMGVLAGLAMSLAEPATAVPAFALGSVWTHYRRVRRNESESEQTAFGLLAWIVPIGLGYSIYRLTDPTSAWLIMAGIVAAVAILARGRSWDDSFWTYWPSGASWAVSVGALSTWNQTGLHPMWVVAAFGLAAFVTLIGPDWSEPRLWAASGLASSGLAVALEGSAYPGDLRPAVWAIVGAAAVAAATMWRRHPAEHLAGVGHVIGLGALFGIGSAYLLNRPIPAAVPVVVLGAWTVGWALSTMSGNRDGASLTALLDRSAKRIPDLPEQPMAVAQWVAPTAFVWSIPPTVLTAANLWGPFSAHRSWAGVLLGGIAIAYGVMSRLKRSRTPLDRVLITGAIVASGIGVAVAQRDSWPTIAAACAVIAVAALTSGRLRRSGFVWFAWVMSIVMILLLAEQAGVAPNRLHLVSHVWGGLLLVGGLVLDDQRSGRRTFGERLRTEWIRYPVLLGALVLPISLGQAFVSNASYLGQSSITAGILYLVVAYLMRVGSVSALGYALISLGTAVMVPWFQIDQPWRLVSLATALVFVSWIADRRQTEEAAKDLWMGWSLAPLVVAHLIALLALVLGAGTSPQYPTFLAFGLLSLSIAGWRRHRGWLEAGNLMLLVAANDAGPGWLTLGLAGTAVKAIMTVRHVEGPPRVGYQIMSTVSAGLAWLAFLAWRGYVPLAEVNSSVVLFGSLALIVAGLRRSGLVKRDTLTFWIGLGAAGLMATTFVTISVGPGVQGPWFALGFVACAAAIAISANELGSASPAVSLVTIGLAWELLAIGMNWELSMALTASMIVFGSLFIASVELLRRRGRPSDSGHNAVHEPVSFRHPIAMAASLGAAGLAASAAGAAFITEPASLGLWSASGLGLLAIGTGRAARPFTLGWLRSGSAVAGYLAATQLGVALEVSVVALAAGSIAIAMLAVVGLLWIWKSSPGSVWEMAVVTLGLSANLAAVAMTINTLPNLQLIVAVLLSLGVQATAIGIVRTRPEVLGFGPPLFGLAVILMITESVSGSVQWYTVPIGLVVLSEVEILRVTRSRADRGSDTSSVLVLEWAGIALLSGPPIVEMFVTRIMSGLIAFAVAGGLLLWAIVTRVKRRALSAASLAVATAVLILFAAAAEQTGESAYFWIVAVGFGFAVMLVAALIEAQRSKKGRVMARVGQLMEDWE